LGEDLSAVEVHSFLASNGIKGDVKNWHGRRMTVYKISDVDDLLLRLRKKNQSKSEISPKKVENSDYRLPYPENIDDDSLNDDYDETDMEACSNYLIKKYQFESRRPVSMIITESQRRRLFRC
jgi:hypothetical protein